MNPKPNLQPVVVFVLGVLLGGLLVAVSVTKDRRGNFVMSDSNRQCLNRLREALCDRFGYWDGAPRVNQGPCGPLALEFLAAWNCRFIQPCRLAYVMSSDNRICHHILVQLPDGSFFDGGNGLMTLQTLHQGYPGSLIDTPEEFDLGQLEIRAAGLVRYYELCPNYDHAAARALILAHLDQLAGRRLLPVFFRPRESPIGLRRTRGNIGSHAGVRPGLRSSARGGILVGEACQVGEMSTFAFAS